MSLPIRELEVVVAAPPREPEQGGVAVVLLHGWGAPGDDLVPLAESLAAPGTRFYLPAAPLPEVGGGRAWWHLDEDRPAHAYSGDVPDGHRLHPEVASAAAAVEELLRQIRQRQSPRALVLAGFSQGAMLSLHVALTGAVAIDRVAALSTVLLVDTVAAFAQFASRPPLPIFMAHGRSDPLLPFAGAERARQILQARGHAVTFHPFEGGHEIPDDVVRALGELIQASPA